MTYTRLPYEDASTPAQMSADCHAVEDAMRRLTPAARRAVATANVVAPPPSIAYEDYPREVHKSELSVSEAAARLAAALELHID